MEISLVLLKTILFNDYFSKSYDFWKFAGFTANWRIDVIVKKRMGKSLHPGILFHTIKQKRRKENFRWNFLLHIIMIWDSKLNYTVMILTGSNKISREIKKR